jgi:predicted secreted hydrolase
MAAGNGVAFQAITMLSRRTVLAATMGMGAAPTAWSLEPPHLRFPRDAGSHNDFATEWWYVTGYANSSGTTAALGFQLTFFRSRVAATQDMQSRLAARQLVFAHAAVTDVQGRKLWHDQRLARWSGEPTGNNPADTASASDQDTGVKLRDWSLLRVGSDLHAHIPAAGFTLNLQFRATQAVLLQGQQGLSRKGPDAQQASYYYSLPQLQVSGRIELDKRQYPLQIGSTAWLDHEWSQQVMHPQAVGWDWIGINLLDGSALTAFQIRQHDGSVLWDGGSFRSLEGTLYPFSRGEVLFKPLRSWRSALSQANYPVEWMVRTPADYYTVKAVLDNQELDSRGSTGAIYWEGLCEVWDSNNRLAGRGYLEMTGYAAALTL